MAELSMKGLGKTYDGGVEVIRGVDLTVRDGEFMVFVGPSGCGKSTTLRMIAGLEDLSRGELHIGGQPVHDRPPAERGVAMVFQSYALYPHMTVAQNMGFALKLAGVKPAAVAQAVDRAARILRLEALLDRKPKALSGGQRQRVAIGRAIVRDPQVFLFDEPLSNLDAALRVQMREELARLHAELGTTMVYVTHDQVEAMTLGQRIAVFNAGRIEQCDTPQALYERPATLFVASFIGSPQMNLLPLTWAASAQGPSLFLGDWRWTPPAPARFRWPEGRPRLTLGFRPEHVRLRPAGEGDLPCRVERVEYLGSEQIVYLRPAMATDAPTLRVRELLDAPHASPGAALDLVLDAPRLHLFGEDGQTLAQP
jgi:multiple sugar transport system ATP-binding protein